MLKEWTDRMPPQAAADIWRRAMETEVALQAKRLEQELRREMALRECPPTGFYEAMRHFLTLREKLFPDFPADPAWKILVTLAQTPEHSPKGSVTGIAMGADVPLATAIRYIAAMELQGLIERVPHPTDKRQIMIRLTKEGQRRLDAIAEGWRGRIAMVIAIPVLLFYAVKAYAAG